MPRIVVGVDGSFSSRRALAWAAREAVLRDCELEAVYAWSINAIAWASPTTALMLHNTDLQKVGEELLIATIDELGETSARITAMVIEDVPADALLDRSRGAEMLVLGARGSDPLGPFRICPTHKQCLNHATCVVVIVPEENS